MFHSEDRRPEYEELKKLETASKYQIQELLKEKRITQYDILNSKMNLNKKQYKYFVHHANDVFVEQRERLIEATKKINDARNMIIKILTEFDSQHHFMKDTDFLPNSQSSEAGIYFETNKLGIDITSQKFLKFKKVAQKLEYWNDPKSNSTKLIENPEDYEDFTWKTEVVYNLPASS